jgi:DMSO/TMAO reductase YedYZ molybdopterin-dependent catalytic subunit
LENWEVTVKDRDGNNHFFKGVKLSDILDSAGVTLNHELRGKNLRKFILMEAADGYQVVFSVTEVDPGSTNYPAVLLVFEMDGRPLPKGEGPFRIIAPGDKRPARWIRELNTIKVISASK